MKINFDASKIDWTKIAGAAGTLLALGASMLSNYSSEKQQEAKIKEEVEKALKNK